MPSTDYDVWDQVYAAADILALDDEEALYALGLRGDEFWQWLRERSA